MPVFFVHSSQISGGILKINGPQARHIGGALRKQPGEQILVIDEHRIGYTAQLLEVKRDQILARVIGEKKEAPVSPISITLAQAILKAKKMDWVLQKATELGVSRIIPLITERTVVDPHPERTSHQHHRWQEILREAAQQSERWDIPDLDFPTRLPRLLEQETGYDCGLIPWEREAAADLRAGIRQAIQGKAQIRKILVVIGPEGGFAEQEVDWARQHLILPVNLGPRILRAETASLAVLAILQYELGGMGRE